MKIASALTDKDLPEKGEIYFVVNPMAKLWIPQNVDGPTYLVGC
jgi:hypothetical protein